MWKFFTENPSSLASFSVLSLAAVSKNTVDFEATLASDADYDKNWEIVKKVVADRESVPVAHWAEDANFGKEEAEATRYVLNSWERAANRVAKKVYDGHFLYEMYGTHVISMHDFLIPYILRVRGGSSAEGILQVSRHG